MNFNDVFQKIVVEIEGFYSNDKNDPGGETVFGLTRVADLDWEGWAIVDRHNGNHRKMPYDVLRAMAMPYYKRKYWDFAQLDKFPIEVAYQMFDIGVNMGKGIAVRFLQRTLNVLNHNGHDYPDLIEDGIFGPNTLNAMQKIKTLKRWQNI